MYVIYSNVLLLGLLNFKSVLEERIGFLIEFVISESGVEISGSLNFGDILIFYYFLLSNFFEDYFHTVPNSTVLYVTGKM